MLQQDCPHRGEIPKKESFFAPRREFIWRLLGSEADDLYVECSTCGWHQLTHNIDRLSFFWDIEGYLPEHP